MAKTEAWVAGGGTGTLYFDSLVDAGFSDDEASAFSVIAARLDNDKGRDFIINVAKQNGYTITFDNQI